jgi:16S rRNA (adenine1518-N6/adenine1519-N6)-dimethyltransferase
VTLARRRALGQHFLRDPRVAQAMVALVAPTPRDLVVEIGAGEGALTRELRGRAGRLIALEVDRRLAERLRRRWPELEVVVADARRWDYGVLTPPPGGRVLVVGNLPYAAATRILRALLAARGALHEMALMFQREVADRVVASPGSRARGSLSVLTQLVCDVRIALRVPPGAFRPPPRVHSAVVHFRVLPAPRVPVADERWFATVVQAAFGQRRKTLPNALAARLGLPVERVRALVEAAGIDPGRRAETLTISEFAELAARVSSG